ncbi:MAG TPA: hypothetical protein VIK53_03980 [Verrucomicrobiae bacterium]
MKSKYTMAGAVMLAAIAGLVVNGCVSEKANETITLDQVPAAVKTTLATYAATADVKTVELGDQDGTKVYEFDIEQGARKFEVAITPDGKFNGMEEDMALSVMPAAAQKALNDAANGGKISGGEKAVDANQKVTYEADIEKGGKKSEVAVDADGKVVSTESITGGKDEKD